MYLGDNVGEVRRAVCPFNLGNGIDWCRVKADKIPVRRIVSDARGVGVSL